MDTLFWPLLDNKNSDVANYWSQALFQRNQKVPTEAHVVEEAYALEAHLSNDDSGNDEAVEEEDNEAEMEQSRDPKNNTATEIKALVSVSLMVCQSPIIEGDVDAAYVKKQPYAEKQESMPARSLQICVKIINGHRKLVPKTTDPFQMIRWFPHQTA